MKVRHLRHFFCRSRQVKIKHTSDGISLENRSASPQKVLLGKPFKVTNGYLKITFQGTATNDAAHLAQIRFVNARRQVSEPANLNATTVIRSLSHYADPIWHLAYLTLPAHAQLVVTDLSVSETTEYTIYDNPKQSDILVITPMYPSAGNPYSATFVASKVEAYHAHGLKTDVVIVSGAEQRLYRYEYHGDIIHKVSFDELRNLIQRHHYKKILVHFLSPEIGNALTACDLDVTDVIVFCHGADVDCMNPDIYSHYFARDYTFSPSELRSRQLQRETLKKFNAMPNVLWVFNTHWNLTNAQQANNLDFANHKIIPCVINEQKFPYQKRQKDQKHKILVIKKMNNERQYAVDIATRIILALSRKPYFKNLEFTVVGAGNFQPELTSPLKNFSNVTLVNHFIANDQLSDLFLEHGILLAPSRYDTQGVTTCEGAMSGLAIVASKGTGLSDILPEDAGSFFSNDNLDEAVQIIEDIYLGKKDISSLSSAFHKAVLQNASTHAIESEIALLKTKPAHHNRLTNPPAPSSDATTKTPLLTIAIPSYNAAQYLENGVKSLLSQRNAHLLEILIIDDGSTDNTETVAKNLLKQLPPSLKSRVKYIKKPNGGHGSTVNKGLELAKGTYFRLMDADDRMDSTALADHLDFLASTDADIVFTNTVHDLSIPSRFRPDHKYDFMSPHHTYAFDDLCYEHYGFPGYGVVLSTTSIKTDKLRSVGCRLTEHCFYVDMEFNLYATIAADTAAFDPVELYYYYLGRSGQSLAATSYKRNFHQYLKVSESLINILNSHDLSDLKRQHFLRAQLKETFAHQYRIALDMIGTPRAFKEVEQMMRQYPEYYNDRSLIPARVFRYRKYGRLYFGIRRSGLWLRNRLRTVKHFLFH